MKYDMNLIRIQEIKDICKFSHIVNNRNSILKNKKAVTLSVQDICDIVNISPKQYLKYKQEGISVKEMLHNYCDNKKDDSFDKLSINQFCKKCDISRKTYYRKINSGYSRKQIFEQTAKSYNNEQRIKSYLELKHICFYHNKTFSKIFDDFNIDKSFLSKKTERLRPDFVIFKDNVIIGFIEEDGENHFCKNIKSPGLFEIKQRDLIKQDFIENLGYPLLRIKYSQMDDFRYMINDFLNNPSDYLYKHNTFYCNEDYFNL